MKYNPDLQLEVLKKKFGLNLNWVEVNVPMTYSEVEKYFGRGDINQCTPK